MLYEIRCQPAIGNIATFLKIEISDDTKSESTGYLICPKAVVINTIRIILRIFWKLRGFSLSSKFLPVLDSVKQLTKNYGKYN